MCYTEEQIEKYLEILNNYNNASTNQAVEDGIRCWNCQSDRRDCFFVNSGYSICEEISKNIHKYMAGVRIPCKYCTRAFRNKKTLNKHYKVIHKIEKIISISNYIEIS